MTMPAMLRTLTLATVVAMAATVAAAARAAGGHHAVEDAALLDPGQCQIETWWDRESGGARSLRHVGPGCRVGAVELGLNVDKVRQQDAVTTSITGAQVKWARALGADWSAGAVLGIAAQDHEPRYLGGAIVVPVTWQVTEALLAHFNIWRDFRRGQPDTGRAGIALEWSPLATATLIAERFKEGGVNFKRAGARWASTPAISIDLSRARGMGMDGGAGAWWTLGLNWVFER